MMQIRKILVPTDFSQPSLIAFTYGIALAHKFQATLVPMHIVEAADFEKDAHSLIQRMLTELTWPEDKGLNIRPEVRLRSDDVQKELLAVIHEEHPDIVVMGTHGRGIIGRLLMGSVTQHVLRHLEVPVLSVSHVGQLPAFNRILLASDLTEPPAEEVSDFALDFAQTTHADLVAVHVVDVGVESGAEAATYLGGERKIEAQEWMTMLDAEAAKRNIPVKNVIMEGEPADAILKAARENRSDLIMIAVEKRSSPPSSTAERIVREAPIAVLSVPVDVEVRAAVPEEPAIPEPAVPEEPAA